jgi:voltage-gated potassium channel Kch
LVRNPSDGASDTVCFCRSNNSGRSSIATIQGIAFFRLVRLYYILTLIEGSRFVLLSAFSIITIVFGALGVYLTEVGNPNTNIRDISDAFWWAIETVTAVGYGDVYPTTAEGRIIGSFVMFARIGILATFITALGAKLIELRLSRSIKEEK